MPQSAAKAARDSSNKEHPMRHPLPFVLAGLLCAAPALALDLPTRKAGLWDIKMTMEGRSMPPMGVQQCVDAATDKQMNSIGGNMRQEQCSKQDMQKVGSTIVVDSVCKVGQATVTTHAVITGDFNSAYTVKVTSKRDGAVGPGMPAEGSTNMTIEAKWLSACKADQKPGDMIMANGQKINIRDMPNMQGPPPGTPGRPPSAPPQKK
jgi:hypothetical protein